MVHKSGIWRGLESRISTNESDISTLQDKNKTVPIFFPFGDGSNAISSGTQLWTPLKLSGDITEWWILADQSGSITIDLWLDTYANYPPTDSESIVNGNEPSLSSAQKNQVTDLSGWSSTSLSVDDILLANVDSASTVTAATLILFVE